MAPLTPRLASLSLRAASRLARPVAHSPAIRTTPSLSTLGPRSLLRQRRAYSSEPPRRSSNQIKFWPFLVLIGIGSLGYAGLVKQRVELNNSMSQQPQLSQPAKPVPTFSPDDVTVLFVLGGPGAGKGTQCAKLVSEHGFIHLSAGDLLRAEQERPGSQFGDLIRDYIKNGLIVPMEVTIQLLENAMTEALQKSGSSKGRFLIDGFPRKLDQAHKFEDSVCPAKLVLFFDCPEETMEKRLLERGKTSGRADDNAESIRKRFRTFIETSMPVVDYFESKGKVVKVDATPPPDSVYKTTEKRLAERLGSSF
ncbi:adenylate kinase-domain-containing protein [Stachybotrys elegans]|uniref:Uridylate kinase n=1 Tax=Stachybotrys elegans TaxID=80388 RepID=A0A8K0T2J5_9HYPO|nr:adenylate kinase-domain-containing protein [Stachybotrys elegans]